MAFVSAAFAALVAVTVGFYFLCPAKYQWVVLLAASYLYFWINSEWLVLALLVTTVVTYYIAKWEYRISSDSKRYLKENSADLTSAEKKNIKEKTKRKTKRILLLGVIFDLGILLVLKYYNFFAGVSNSLLQYIGVELPNFRFLLPLGISFYTLQAVSYMTDVYRGKYEPDQHLGKFMLFMSYFPQIVQGPIARHNQLAHQLYESHIFDYKRVMFGIQLMLWGWMKKLILADRIAYIANEIFDNYIMYHGLMILFGAACYGVQVYADFSSGMDIARGISQMLGIELELNFRQPYFSKSIEEFWRRWHITLGGWMRDYVFYPLSLSKTFGKLSKLSRKVFGQFIGKRLPAFLSMFIVYFLVGFWHGPDWKYIIYGVWNGVFIVAGILLEEFYSRARGRMNIDRHPYLWPGFQMVRTFILVSLGRIWSRAVSWEAGYYMVKHFLLSLFNMDFLVNGSIHMSGLSEQELTLVLVSVIVLLVVDYFHERGVQIREVIAGQNIVIRWIIYYTAILLVLIFGMYGPNYNASSFIYAQF